MGRNRKLSILLICERAHSMLYYAPEMASKHSITKKRRHSKIVNLILTIGIVEMSVLRFIFSCFSAIFRFLIRYIVSILCIASGAAIAYLFFYFFAVLPSPTLLSQYQKLPSIVIFDHAGTLLYQEWNSPRYTVSTSEVSLYRNVLPSKGDMASYLVSQSDALKKANDVYWYAKKMMAYPYDTIATTYMNAKVFQNGVVGIQDASEAYFQKDSKAVEKQVLQKLLSLHSATPVQKKLYARLPVETYAIRDYVEKKNSGKKTGWLYVETSLDVQIGTKLAYQSIVNPDMDTAVFEGDTVRAWTKGDEKLLAEKAIMKTKEGGEYK